MEISIYKLLFLGLVLSCYAEKLPHKNRKAFVILTSTSSSNVEGSIFFYETDHGVLVNGSVIGLTPGFHGFHVHEKGDIGNDCKNAGSHFNPFRKNHGGKYSKDRHVGDLGNIVAEENGAANVVIEDSVISLDPSSQAYIGNLALVIHEDRDDLGKFDNQGSLKTGNAGARVGCGIIVPDGIEEPVQTSRPPVQPVDLVPPKQPDVPVVSTQTNEVDNSIGKTQTEPNDNRGRKAFVIVSSTLSSKVEGSVFFHGTENGLIINGTVTGLSPGFHGFHVHEKGDLGNNCKNAGSHFNPFNKKHGGKYSKERHVGDLGNIVAKDDGVADIDIEDYLVSLDPKSKAYIGDLALVIHEGRDDLGKFDNEGSLKTGNAGARVGCGIIVQEGVERPQTITSKPAKPIQTVTQRPFGLFGTNQPTTTTRRSFQTTRSPPQVFPASTDAKEFATVTLVPGSNRKIRGTLTLSSTQNGILIEGIVSGLSPGFHGFHVHEIGDLSNQCKSSGGHFNPFSQTHGAPQDQVRHVGDLGNIRANQIGISSVRILDNLISDDPSNLAYIGNLAIVIHSGEDDLGRGGNPGSLKTGNAGTRDGCGIIEVTGKQSLTQVEPENPKIPQEVPQGIPQEVPQVAQQLPQGVDPQFTKFATVQMFPGVNRNLDGFIEISFNEKGVLLEGQITGLSPGEHGFHIHESGDLGNRCKNSGGHFNPYNDEHGAPTDQMRHVGDLGNLRADFDGVASFTIFDNYISANPESPAYIGNLAIVIHSGRDDLGLGGHPDSLKTGNAGARDGCGVIRLIDQGPPKPQIQSQTPVASLTARVTIGEASNSGVTGQIRISQTANGLSFFGEINGLTPGLHGFHIHEKGDLRNNCANAGGHFNPFNLNHGAPTEVQRHVGDLGNIEADATGSARIQILDNQASLDPSSSTYIGNLAIVVHAERDDLGRGRNRGSLRTGNAGARVGCGLITIDDPRQAIRFPEIQARARIEEAPLLFQRQNFRVKRSHDDEFFSEMFEHDPYASSSDYVSNIVGKAESKIIPGTDKKVKGFLTFTESHDSLIVEGTIHGLKPGLHGFHVHEKGDLGNKCQNAGPHFDPFENDHGGLKDFERHVGDLGNIKANEKGVAKIYLVDHKGSLDPDSVNFIGKRSIVVHAEKDDLGRGFNAESARTGNSGARVGCGFIKLVHKHKSASHQNPHELKSKQIHLLGRGSNPHEDVPVYKSTPRPLLHFGLKDGFHDRFKKN